MQTVALKTPGAIFCWVTAIGAYAIVSCALLGCSSGQRLGRGATSGALEQLREESRAREASGERAPFEQAAGHAVDGTLQALDSPDRQEQLGRVVGLAAESAMRGAMGAVEDRVGRVDGLPRPDSATLGLLGDRLSSGFARGFSRQLRSDLGANGDGPLAQSLSGWLHQASGAVATGLISDLSPRDSEVAAGACRSSIDQRVYELSRVAATGFTDGVAHRLRLPIVLLSFGAGLIVAFAIAGRVQRHHRDVQERP